MQLWTPPSHSVFSSEHHGAPATNVLFGACFLALDRLQQLPPGDDTGMVERVAMADPAAVECVAMVDPAAVECVLRHWTLGDSYLLRWSVGTE